MYGHTDGIREAACLIDANEAAQDAVETDGAAHYLDNYDGEVVELPSGSLAYGLD